jgi:tRNA 2-selenouridine synthase
LNSFIPEPFSILDAQFLRVKSDLPTVAAEDVVTKLAKPTPSIMLLDVRSEGEFFETQIPQSISVPLLDNEQRTLVGTKYKTSGPNAAIHLAEELMKPVWQKKIESWISVVRANQNFPVYVMCWRGGLRSQIVTHVLRNHQVDAIQVRGGSKAVRKHLMTTDFALPDFCVVTGPTGSQKTKLITNNSFWSVDLEKIANHKGSSFGRTLDEHQPAQTTFENHLYLEILKQKEFNATLLFEDESSTIGSVRIPAAIKLNMRNSPVVVVECPLETRVQNIFDEYVLFPLSSNKTTTVGLLKHLQDATLRLQTKLGHQNTNNILEALNRAFINEQPLEAYRHEEWITQLLVDYYDPMYAYSFKRFPRPIEFTGDFKTVNEFLQDKGKNGKI